MIENMLLHRLATTWQDLAATRSRLAKRDLIAEVIGELRESRTGAESGQAEIEVVVSYLSGSLRQRRTGVGWRSVQTLPTPAAEPTLEVLVVDRAFEEMAGMAGAGSVAARTAAVTAVFGAATALEQDFLRGLVFGELRQGAQESQVQDGLARAFGVPLLEVRRAAMLLSSTVRAAGLLWTGGRDALSAVTLSVGTGVQPMLAASAPDAAAAAVKSGLPAQVDYKLDGIRVQVHRNGDDIAVFSRSLDDLTARLPEVVTVARSLDAEVFVLDGEVVALQADGRPEAFQVIAAQAMTLPGSVTGSVTAPDVAAGVQPYFFDILRLDDDDLLDRPLSVRSAVLVETVGLERVVPQHVCQTIEQVAETFATAVALGFEGVVVKNLQAPYAAGRRDSGWVKVKPRHTFDLVVTAIEWGHGRRTGMLSNLHLAARDEASGELIMLGKTFKGMTDEMLAWQTKHFLGLEIGREAHVVLVEPTTVVEIAIDGLQVSTRYPGGVALRFARVLRYRPDKNAAQADTLQAVRRLGGPIATA